MLKQLIENVKVEEIDVSGNIKMLKILADETFMDRSIRNIEIINHNLKIICIKNENGWVMDIKQDYVVKKDDLLVFLGEAENIHEFQKTLL